VALCARCGTFLCGACTEVLEETAYCEPCAERRREATKPSKVVRGLLAANVLGLVFLGAPAVVPRWMALDVRIRVVGVLLALGWTLGSAVAGTVVSTRRLRRREPVGRAAAEKGLRILSALNLAGVALWVALVGVLVLVARLGA
jgi:hypothetical protein